MAIIVIYYYAHRQHIQKLYIHSIKTQSLRQKIQQNIQILTNKILKPKVHKTDHAN